MKRVLFPGVAPRFSAAAPHQPTACSGPRGGLRRGRGGPGRLTAIARCPPALTHCLPLGPPPQTPQPPSARPPPQPAAAAEQHGARRARSHQRRGPATRGAAAAGAGARLLDARRQGRACTGRRRARAQPQQVTLAAGARGAAAPALGRGRALGAGGEGGGAPSCPTACALLGGLMLRPRRCHRGPGLQQLGACSSVKLRVLTLHHPLQTLLPSPSYRRAPPCQVLGGMV
jgi:hypothetical protein